VNNVAVSWFLSSRVTPAMLSNPMRNVGGARSCAWFLFFSSTWRNSALSSGTQVVVHDVRPLLDKEGTCGALGLYLRCDCIPIRLKLRSSLLFEMPFTVGTPCTLCSGTNNAPHQEPLMTESDQHNTSTDFTRVVLFTDSDGRARFREDRVALTEGTSAARLSPLMPSGGFQLRQSPVGFRSQFHCTGAPQWLFVLQGQMEIGLQDGSSRVFGPGQHFYSADTLPEGAAFDPKVHGHWSRQVGNEPLVTLFVRG
jgi:hypothetical protein